MSSTLPSSRQRLISMLAAVIAVAGLGFVVETLRDDPEPVVAASAEPDGAAEEVAVVELSGEIAVAGSAIVAPMIQLQAETFAAAAPDVTVVVAAESTADGIEAFCAGSAPIASADRLMTEDEYAACEAAGVEYVEIRRAVEGLTFVTAPGNDIADCVSFNDLYALLSAQATGSTSWADANAITAAWGGTQFADAPLEVYGPAEDYHTFASLGEVVIGAVADGATGIDATGELVTDVRTDYEHVRRGADRRGRCER
jgi:phosphate transport system substrate-binding protein